MTTRRAGFILFFSGALLSGCMSTGVVDPASWYSGQGVQAPQGTTITVCHGTDCARRERVQFSSNDMVRLQGILTRGASSPAAERQAISKAVQWFEKRVGPQVGSSNDVGGFDFSTVNVAGQMDCIDEATNTTSLLKLAADRGYLRHHRVSRPVARGFFLDGRYPHATAVIVENNSGDSWAVDSWVHDNGVAPDIMPLEEWRRVRPEGLFGA